MPVEATGNVVDLMAALKKSLGQSPAEAPSMGKKAVDVRQIGQKLPVKGGKSAAGRAEKDSSSGGDKVRAQTRLIRLVLVPAVDADQPPLLFLADNAINLCFGDQVADLAVAKAALGALEAEHGALRQ